MRRIWFIAENKRMDRRKKFVVSFLNNEILELLEKYGEEVFLCGNTLLSSLDPDDWEGQRLILKKIGKYYENNVQVVLINQGKIPNKYKKELASYNTLELNGTHEIPIFDSIFNILDIDIRPYYIVMNDILNGHFKNDMTIQSYLSEHNNDIDKGELKLTYDDVIDAIGIFFSKVKVFKGDSDLTSEAIFSDKLHEPIEFLTLSNAEYTEEYPYLFVYKAEVPTDILFIHLMAECLYGEPFNRLVIGNDGNLIFYAGKLGGYEVVRTLKSKYKNSSFAPCFIDEDVCICVCSTEEFPCEDIVNDIKENILASKIYQYCHMCGRDTFQFVTGLTREEFLRNQDVRESKTYLDAVAFQ